MKNNIIIFAGLVLLAVLSRFAAHYWNFTLLGGVFLLAGAIFADKKISLSLMLVTMLISDYFIGFHNQMLVVYLAFAITVLLGTRLTVNQSWYKVAGFGLLGSVLFYLITNFGVWFEGGLYPKTFQGLVDCYVMAIPFFRNQIMADVISSVALFRVAAALKTQLAWSSEKA